MGLLLCGVVTHTRQYFEKFQSYNMSTLDQGSPAPDQEWESNRPSSRGKEDSEESGRGGYDGPSGMDPDGLIDSNWDQVCENFDDMNLREELLRGIYAYGFEKPSAIQQRAIVPCVKGHDVIAQAQSGTGKTATFAVSILQGIGTSIKSVQALVLAPTRELANQIIKVITALGDYMDVECYACIGGTNVRKEIGMLKENGYQVIVGTPGRVLDMIANRRAINAS